MYYEGLFQGKKEKQWGKNFFKRRSLEVDRLEWPRFFFNSEKQIVFFNDVVTSLDTVSRKKKLCLEFKCIWIHKNSRQKNRKINLEKQTH